MEHEERRQHLERILEDLSRQRKFDLDEVLMEVIHLLLELDDEVRPLREAQSGA